VIGEAFKKIEKTFGNGKMKKLIYVCFKELFDDSLLFSVHSTLFDDGKLGIEV
jgi:hypothetical protein